MNCPRCGLLLNDGVCVGCGWEDGVDGIEQVDAWWWRWAIALDQVVEEFIAILRSVLG